jgi:hypothetical protein
MGLPAYIVEGPGGLLFRVPPSGFFTVTWKNYNLYSNLPSYKILHYVLKPF